MTTLPSSVLLGERETPDCVTLPVREGCAPSPGPPVQIYLGTEPAQFRATRAFLWSIEQVRDPGRLYQIYVMSQLARFERTGWTTGFTNYRFAIPHFAGGVGRAIYCDEDQIFLTDPGELFDLDLDDAGYLAISNTETSVMLIDCERMSEIWSLDDARHDKKKAILARTLKHPGIRGPLDPQWNARDSEYVAGRSHLLHYSTLHTQPWRPFPERFVYRTNRDEQLWLDLENGAIEAGFEAFSVDQPTCFFRALKSLDDGPVQPPAVAPAVVQRVRALVGDLGFQSLLEVTASGMSETTVVDARWGAEETSRSGLLPLLRERGSADPPAVESVRDGVVVSSGLEWIPPEDLPWVVERLFRRAGIFLLAAVPCQPLSQPPRGHPPVGTVQTREWWVAHFEAAGRRHPGVHWQLALAEDGDLSGEDFFFRSGGVFPRAGQPRVWVLADDRPGNATQSIGLADELGWPYERIELGFSPFMNLPNPILGARIRGVSRKSRRRLQAPWPDLVIAAGRRTAPVARWISQQSRGRTRIVQLGRKGANPAEPFDLSVVPAHARLISHPRRLETAGVLTHIRRSKLEEAALQWEYLFAPHPSPRIALLVGGGSHRYSFTPEVAEQLGRDVAEMAARVGGSVFVTTSRRTGAAATDALASALPGAAHFHRWAGKQKLSDNPLLGYLALADVLVVTGESESMLAEASATGKSVHIYPLPRRKESIFSRLGSAAVDRIVAHSEREPRNNRGTTRPQQGLELFCSRLIAEGYVRPHRDLHVAHEKMVKRGRARIFDGNLAEQPPIGHSEIEDVADRVRRLVGMDAR
jgi:mitochondrial fission protein ELM1